MRLGGASLGRGGEARPLALGRRRQCRRRRFRHWRGWEGVGASCGRSGVSGVGGVGSLGGVPCFPCFPSAPSFSLSLHPHLSLLLPLYILPQCPRMRWEVAGRLLGVAVHGLVVVVGGLIFVRRGSIRTGWGKLDLKSWGCAIEWSTRGGMVGQKPKTELPGLGFGERNAGGLFFA